MFTISGDQAYLVLPQAERVVLPQDDSTPYTVTKGSGDVEGWRAAEVEVAMLKAKLKGLGMWGFAVYDLGSSSYTLT